MIGPSASRPHATTEIAAGRSCATGGAGGGCRPRPALTERPLLAGADAAALERTFKVLASGTRLRLLHALLRRPGMAVIELAEAVGMKPQAVSNQLQRLTDKGILASVRDGTSVRYRVVDSCIVGLLDQGLCLTEDSWARQKRMSGGNSDERRTDASPRRARQRAGRPA